MCNSAVQAAERAAGVPRYLLSAIARAESGRWNRDRQANIAWPWTVTANGKGRFFDSKLEAVAEAEILLTEGVRNIDVGCMQINLKYHPDAFETLSEAFDPATNASYGASYLRAMREQTGDWRRAAARYHSATPAQARKYQRKVMRLWDQARGLKTREPAPGKPPKNKIETPPAETVAIDYVRNQRLNEAFQARRQRALERETADKSLGQARLRRKQLDAWRQRQVGAIPIQHLANMRRAELALRRAKELNRISAKERADAFAERRRQDLTAWRARLNDPANAAYSN